VASVTGLVTGSLTLGIAVVTAQREAILPLVLAGAGAVLLPEPLAQVAARLGAVVSDPRPPITRSIVLAHRPGPLALAARRSLELAAGAHPASGLPA
jgi:LysR family transcriptional regulator, carnitine catabolism transcriptional activator